MAGSLTLGPTDYYACKVQLSLEARELGCEQCHYYVCRCGQCLCGYTEGTEWDSCLANIRRSQFLGKIELNTYGVQMLAQRLTVGLTQIFSLLVLLAGLGWSARYGVP